MKNLKHLFTALLMLCTTVVSAYDFEVDGFYYNILSEEDKTVEITYKIISRLEPSNSYTGCVVIPETVIYSETTYHVISIGDNAFFNCPNLTDLTIPNSITSIGIEAISHCSGLTSIEIPNSVTSIGDYAFCNSHNLTSITIPNSVTSIGDCAFSGCLFIKSIEIPSSVTSIGHDAFSGCAFGPTSISVAADNSRYDSRDNCNAIIETATNTLILGCKNTIIPNSVTSIGDNAFNQCSNLTKITIPNSITSIGWYAFEGCTGLKEVHISDITAWCGIDFSEGANPLYYADNLYLNGELITELIIPNNVTSIGKFAFNGCAGLTSVEIPNSVTSIGTRAFWGCDGLTSVEIPNSVTSIGTETFCSCNGLTSVEIPNSVTSIGNGAFCDCDGLTSVEIPNSVTSIGTRAFRGCYGLTSITIPNSVTSIGTEAFAYCTGLVTITSCIPSDDLFAVNNTVFSVVNKYSCTLYVPYGAKDTYAATDGWKMFTNIVELAPTEVTITIGQYGNATYCSPFALDFSEVEGLKAYTAIGFNSSTQVVTLARVMTAPAETGIFIKGEPGEYVVPTIEVCNDHTLNLLVGTLEQTTVNSTDGAMSNYKFTIAEGDTAPMFYPFEDNTTFSAGKAYLQIPTAWLPVTAQKSLNIRFDDGETTDIDELKGESGEVKTIYDLQGRVVENPTSGIYIIDGKKIFVK